MFKTILKGRIQYSDAALSWEDAVKQAAVPLLNEGLIASSYVDAMIGNINRLGSYMILMPGVAMPHSRPEDGAKDTGISLLVVKNPVVFPGDQEAWLILCLAASSSDKHIETIEAIADFLGDEAALEALGKAQSIEEISQLMI